MVMTSIRQTKWLASGVAILIHGLAVATTPMAAQVTDSRCWLGLSRASSSPMTKDRDPLTFRVAQDLIGRIVKAEGSENRRASRVASEDEAISHARIEVDQLKDEIEAADEFGPKLWQYEWRGNAKTIETKDEIVFRLREEYAHRFESAYKMPLSVSAERGDKEHKISIEFDDPFAPLVFTVPSSSFVGGWNRTAVSDAVLEKLLPINQNYRSDRLRALSTLAHQLVVIENAHRVERGGGADGASLRYSQALSPAMEQWGVVGPD